MRNLWMLMVMMVVGITTASAQRYYDDRNFYDEDFDWHWDVRVRISDGINAGRLTSWEANKLYRRLERIEEKEYAYMADGRFDTWEENDIWDDVVWLNRKIGLELYDYDRNFYGFGNVYIGFNSYPFWYNRYYSNGWDFYRFDRLGWGNYRYGYVNRYYVPQHNVYVNVNNHIHKDYNNNSRGNNNTSYSRANGNVVTRDRTDPANRVYDSSSRRTTSGTTNSRTYTPSSRSASPNSSSSRTYTPSSRSNGAGNSTDARTSTPNRSNSSTESRTNTPSSRSSSSSTESRTYTPSTRNSSSSSSSGSRTVSPSRSSRSESASSSANRPSSGSVRSSAPSRSSSGSSSAARSSSSSSSRSSGSSSSRSSSGSSRGR